VFHGVPYAFTVFIIVADRSCDRSCAYHPGHGRGLKRRVGGVETQMAEHKRGQT